MAPSNTIADPAVHRKLATDLYNETWNLMDKTLRSAHGDDLMIHMAHASRCHWHVVGNPVNLARGEWQILRDGTINPEDHDFVQNEKLLIHRTIWLPKK